MAITIKKERCLGCGCCIDACDVGALELDAQAGEKWETVICNDDQCIECGQCLELCPNESISL